MEEVGKINLEELYESDNRSCTNPGGYYCDSDSDCENCIYYKEE